MTDQPDFDHAASASRGRAVAGFRAAARRVEHPRSAAHIGAVSIAAALLTLPDPARCTPAGRLLLRAGTATLTGLVAWAGGREEAASPLLAPVRIGVTAAAVGVSLAAAEAEEAVDARVTTALTGRVPRPRLVMAAVTAGIVAATMAATQVRSRRPAADNNDAADNDESRDGQGDNGEGDSDGMGERRTEIPDDVRAIVGTFLESTQGWGSRALRAQLDAATAVPYIGLDESAFYPGTGFCVPEDLPRAVPADARFPISGRYHPFGGRSAEVYVSVVDGRLDTLTIAPGEDWTDEDHIRWMEAGHSVQDLTGWPNPEELTLLVDTPHGRNPL